MQIRVMRLRTMLLIGVRPPVEALTLLRPYPPKAGRAMKHPPTRFATPRATSSRLADNVMPCSSSPGVVAPPPRAFAAMEDSKKPSRAMRKEVLIASRTCFMCDGTKGQWNGIGDPLLDLTSPRMESPFSCHEKAQVKTAERTTTTKRSGTYATEGNRGCSLRFKVLLVAKHQHKTGIAVFGRPMVLLDLTLPRIALTYLQTMMMAKVVNATTVVNLCAEPTFSTKKTNLSTLLL